MGKAEVEKQKQEALQARLSQQMLETQSEATPFPDKLTTLEELSLTMSRSRFGF